MNKNKKSLALLLLLSANQSFNVNAGIGDFFQNVWDEAVRLGMVVDSVAIDATDALDKKLNTDGVTKIRQAFTGVIMPAYLLNNPDDFDNIVRNVSLSGYLDLEKEFILEIARQIKLLEGGASMMPIAEQAKEAERIMHSLKKLAIGFKQRLFGNSSSGATSKAEFNAFMSLINNSENEAHQMAKDNNEEMSLADTAILTVLILVLIGIALVVACLVLKCSDAEQEEYRVSVKNFKQKTIPAHLFAEGGEMARNLSVASTDTLASF